MDASLHVVPVSPELLDLLVVLEQRTFSETFVHQYNPADFQAFMEEKKSKKAIQDEMAAPGCLYYILYEGTSPAGFLKLNLHKQPENVAAQPGPVMELEKIYVLKAFQGMKAGQFLLDYTLELAAQHGVKTVWLGVWEYNTKAYQFYEKNGFEKFGSHKFMMGAQEDTDWLMRKQL
jgi:ribosomal protein S18 acetylase RimI-like enzyme